MELVGVKWLCAAAGLRVSTEVVQTVARGVSISFPVRVVLGGGLSVFSEGAVVEAVCLLACIAVVLSDVEGVCVSSKGALVEAMLAVASLVVVLGSPEGLSEDAELWVAVEGEVEKDAFVVTLLKVLLVWYEEV